MNKEITVHRFSVSVNCGLSGKEVYDDSAVLMLPSSYTEDGEPTLLVISCHGAGGSVDTDDAQIEGQVFTKYLLANGYAVMDVNGLPRAYADIAGVDIRNNIGSPIALQSYVKAYQYCVERFNLRREVFVHGASMGGISSTNLVLSGLVPVIAQSGFCPVLDTYGQIFLHPWSNGLPKTALGVFYGLEKDSEGELIYDEEKVRGFNPMGRCETKDGKEYVSYPVPVKFWQCEDDSVVSIDTTKRFVAAIKNAGGEAYLRVFDKGGHEPQDYGAPVELPSGRCVIDGKTLEVKAAVEEAFSWLKSFS